MPDCLRVSTNRALDAELRQKKYQHKASTSHHDALRHWTLNAELCQKRYLWKKRQQKAATNPDHETHARFREMG